MIDEYFEFGKAWEFNVYDKDDELWVDIWLNGELVVEDILLEDFIYALMDLEYQCFGQARIPELLILEKDRGLLKLKSDTEFSNKHWLVVGNFKAFVNQFREFLLKLTRKHIGYLLKFIFS